MDICDRDVSVVRTSVSVGVLLLVWEGESVGMPRPTISEDDLDRMERIVDERTKVPVDHLTTEERLAFVLDELEEAEARASRLGDRVDRLEETLAEARDGGDRGASGSPAGVSTGRRGFQGTGGRR